MKTKNDQNTLNELCVYGRQIVLEALRSACNVKNIWIAKNAAGKNIGQIKKLAELKGVPIQYVNQNDLQKIVGAVVHQGSAALVKFKPFINDDLFYQIIQSKSNPFILILDQIQDTHNLGAILRTAEITAVDIIVIPQKGSAQINATTAKTSAGALFNIKLYQAGDIPNLIESLRQTNIPTYAAASDAKKNIYEVDLKKSAAVIIGSEGRGVRKNLADLCDASISIPQYGKVNSLNASVSAAVILYEVIRQRHYPGKD